MKIVDAESVKTTNGRGKKELNPVEKYLFDKEQKKVRLTTLINMENDKAATVDLEEFKNYGSYKGNIRGYDRQMNQLFILGSLPLIARRASDNEIVIRKLATFSLDEYNKSDKKPMSANHLETVKAKLAETLG